MSGRRWTQEDEAYLRANLGKTDIQTIMQQLNRTIGAIRERAWELGISHMLNYQDAAFKKALDDNNQSKKSLYQRRCEEGICTRCGRRWPEAGRRKCRPCRERDQKHYRDNHMREYLRDYKNRQKAERRANYQCYNCGAKLPEGASGQCAKCRKKQRERTNMYRLRLRIHGIPRSDRR